MGKALEMLNGFVTAPSTTLTALTMGAGDTLVVRNAPLDSQIMLLQAWTDNQTAGTFRIRSPRLHDNVEGIRLDASASEVKPLLPRRIVQPLIPQDTLTAQLSGSGTGGDIESAALLLFYENLPGISSRLIDVATLLANMMHLVSVENTLALGTGGGYAIDVSRDDAMELTQEAFLKTYKARETYREGEPFLPWFHRILRNTCFSFLRKHKRIAKHSLSGASEEDEADWEIEGDEPAPSEGLERDEVARARGKSNRTRSSSTSTKASRAVREITTGSPAVHRGFSLREPRWCRRPR